MLTSPLGNNKGVFFVVFCVRLSLVMRETTWSSIRRNVSESSFKGEGKDNRAARTRQMLDENQLI